MTKWRELGNLFIANSLPKHKVIILDVGCGNNKLSTPYVTPGSQIIGVDKEDFECVDIVHNLELGMPQLELEPDVILMNNYLEHCINPVEIINNSFEILRQGGLIVVVVPFLIKLHQTPNDYFRYTPFALDKLLRQAGFAEISIRPLISIQDSIEQLHKSSFELLNRKYSYGGEEPLMTTRLWRRLVRLLAVTSLKLYWYFYASILHKDRIYDATFTIGYGVTARKPI